MRTEQEIRERLEKFLKDNPFEWVYGQDNPALQVVYQTTKSELYWVLDESED